MQATCWSTICPARSAGEQVTAKSGPLFYPPVQQPRGAPVVFTGVSGSGASRRLWAAQGWEMFLLATCLHPPATTDANLAVLCSPVHRRLTGLAQVAPKLQHRLRNQ